MKQEMLRRRLHIELFVEGLRLDELNIPTNSRKSMLQQVMNETTLISTYLLKLTLPLSASHFEKGKSSSKPSFFRR